MIHFSFNKNFLCNHQWNKLLTICRCLFQEKVTETKKAKKEENGDNDAENDDEEVDGEDEEGNVTFNYIT